MLLRIPRKLIKNQLAYCQNSKNLSLHLRLALIAGSSSQSITLLQHRLHLFLSCASSLFFISPFTTSFQNFFVLPLFMCPEILFTLILLIKFVSRCTRYLNLISTRWYSKSSTSLLSFSKPFEIFTITYPSRDLSSIHYTNEKSFSLKSNLLTVWFIG